MGAKSSKQSPMTCNDCNCEAEVPRVLAACNKAGSSGVSNTLEQSITSLMGKENADLIIKEYTSAVGSNRDSKWVSDYEKIAERFNNREGFIEGNCVPCDCTAAANDIINECQKSTQQIPSTITSIIKDGNINTGTSDLISPIMDEANNIEETNSDWKTVFYPYIKATPSIKEGYIDRQSALESEDTTTRPPPSEDTTTPSRPSEDTTTPSRPSEDTTTPSRPATQPTGATGTPTFLLNALNSRYNRFSNDPTYGTDCQTNAYRTMQGFIRDETIQDLYDYYIAFTENYESLYLHRESFTKIINNKYDELQKIQSKIDSYKKHSHVDNRKNLYQSTSYDFYSNIHLYMLILYYSALVIYFIFSKFLSEKQYTNKLLVLLLFIYFITPIILAYLINFAYEGYIYFLEYNNLKEDTKSYEDIIK